MKKRKPAGIKGGISGFLKSGQNISIAVSICSLAVSFFALRSTYESRPLAYYATPVITSAAEGSLDWELELVVTNGAIGDVRVIDYRDGQITEIANNVGGVIRKGASRDGRTFKFRLDYAPYGQADEFYATEYILVHGKDGSRHTGMVLFHMNIPAGEVQVRYYSQEDLFFAEMDPGQAIYADALSNYRTLLEMLRENGEI